jgi:hypothetical protein
MAVLDSENLPEIVVRENSAKSHKIQAVLKIQKALVEAGWELQENLKLPCATKGKFRVWFKSQSLYFTIEPHLYSEAKRLWVEPQKICEMNPKRISAGIVGLIRKLSVQGDKK